MTRLCAFSMAVVMCLASAAVACDPKCKDGKKSKDVQAVSAKTTDGQVASTKVTDSAAPKCHKGKAKASKAATVSSKPCCAKGKAKAAVAAATKPCSKGKAKAATVSSKPCCAKGKEKAKATTSLVAGKPCCSKSKAKTVSSSPELPSCCKKKAKAALASLPALTYKVGSFSTQCKYSAKAKAEETKATIQYVVGEKTFSTYDEAATTLTAMLNEQAAVMRTVRYVAGKECVGCPTMAAKLAKATGTKIKYRVAGFDFDSKEKAERIAKRLDSTLTGVSMKYLVDGKEVACCAAAKKEGKKITYVIGDKKTECETTAKLMLAEHVVRTIVDTVASAAAKQTGA